MCDDDGGGGDNYNNKLSFIIRTTRLEKYKTLLFIDDILFFCRKSSNIYTHTKSTRTNK